MISTKNGESELKVVKANSNQSSGNKLVKSNLYRFFLTGVGFALILILPSLDQWLGWSSGFENTEKHTLAVRPTLHFPHVLTYISQFNQYYKENFGWRNALFHQYSHFKYIVMGVSPLPQKVILGKNGWFYPGNDFNQVADQHQGILPISLETAQTIAKKLTTKQQQLASQGTKFYLFISPDSYSIYPENLPNYLQQTSIKSNFDLLKDYLTKHTTVPLIDARPALLAAKPVHKTYMQTDTHWNDYGALIATLTIVDRVRQDFPNLPEPKEGDYAIRVKKGYSGDLVTMLALGSTISDTVNYQIDPPSFLVAKEVEHTESNESGTRVSQRYVSATKNSPTLLFVGDSFTITLRQRVPGYFSKAHFLRSNRMADELANPEKSDVVILEIAERNLVDLISL